MKDIKFIFDNENHILHAYSDFPLEIENQFLQYRITVELVEFSMYLQNSKSLKATNMDSVSIVFLPHFKDIAKNNKYSARRQKIYAFSKSRFFKLLYDRKIDYSDFYLIDYNKLLNDSVKFLNAEEVFFRNELIGDSSTVKIILNPELKNTAGESRICVANIKTLYGVIGATQKPVKVEQTYTGVNGPNFYSVTFSKMFFRTDTFNIDSYGNTDLNKNLFLNGTMGMQ